MRHRSLPCFQVRPVGGGRGSGSCCRAAAHRSALDVPRLGALHGPRARVGRRAPRSPSHRQRDRRRGARHPFMRPRRGQRPLEASEHGLSKRNPRPGASRHAQSTRRLVRPARWDGETAPECAARPSPHALKRYRGGSEASGDAQVFKTAGVCSNDDAGLEIRRQLPPLTKVCGMFLLSGTSAVGPGTTVGGTHGEQEAWR